ncbi:hypothetical protein RhiirA4_440562 [Rhizophagus irregularis]|uniref:Uncharacterized protein n=1 Tax=Rhizophagus irregularis TaxID=588596 RepID=A0A2I1G0Y0_9GLOM|nr:hypothetical protein RhiirA4_440562 [Rhizophagus irregularis]
MKDRGPVLQVLGPTGPGPSRTGSYVGSEIDLQCGVPGSDCCCLILLFHDIDDARHGGAGSTHEIYTGTLLPLGGFLLKDEDVKKNSGRTKFLVRINSKRKYRAADLIEYIVGVTESRMGFIKVNNLDVYGVLFLQLLEELHSNWLVILQVLRPLE